MTEIKDLQDPYLRRMIKARNYIALVPVGSLEQHGPHLPISTDADIVSSIAKKVSEKANFLLLPTVTYGASFEHSPYFNLSITKSSLQKILVEICISLWKNKIRNIIILNGHHGNQSALKKIPQKVRVLSSGRARVFVFSYWHSMKREFDHAGFVETSLMLAISKKVMMKKAKKGLIVDKLSDEKRRRLDKLASKSFPSVTKSGVWGDPRKATANDGRQIFREIVRGILKMSQTCLTDKTRKLHQ